MELLSLISKYPNLALSLSGFIVSLFILSLILILPMTIFFWNFLIGFLLKIKYAAVLEQLRVNNTNVIIATLGQLLGSFMLFSLAFGANDWLGYALSIIIIATLVANSDFVTDIVALLGKSKEYWNMKTAVNVQYDETKKLLMQVDNLTKNLQDERIRNAVDKLYGAIFGSQITLIGMLISSKKGMSLDEIVEFHKTTPLHETYLVYDYMGFLLRQGLVEITKNRKGNVLYKVTELGSEFYGYLIANGYNLNKPY